MNPVFASPATIYAKLLLLRLFCEIKGSLGQRHTNVYKLIGQLDELKSEYPVQKDYLSSIHGTW